ncbi:MAG TPA: serine protease [Acidimicrobiales bacterium]
MRRLLLVLALLTASLAAGAAPAAAIVGGSDASPGEYPAVAQISYGVFSCTGTLIAPDTVLTAGHCSSVDAGVVGTPVTWPAALIDVRIGSHRDGDGERVPVSSVVAHQNYLATKGYDISLLRLSRASSKAPVKVAGAGERGIWSAGTVETIVGWGVTEEDGDAPDVLQEAQVPVTTDAYCGGAYGDFDARTMVCAGYPQGGVDTCQGDSGGPMFGRASDGSLRVVGTTSFGEGCARPNKPGVYGRVGDDTLREWIRQRVPNGVN